MFFVICDPKLVPPLATKPCVVKHTHVKNNCAITHHLIIIMCISFYLDFVSHNLEMRNNKDLPPRSWSLIHPNLSSLDWFEIFEPHLEIYLT